MPLGLAKVGKKFRLVDTSTGRIEKNAAGTAADGGGHSSKAAALKQIQAINISKARAKGAKIPR